MIKPHYRVDRVTDITIDRLQRLGIELLLLDVDCTLKPYVDEMPDESVMQWLESLQAAGVELCLCSNGRGPRIERFAASVDLPFVATSMKPFPFKLWKTAKRFKKSVRRCAIAGDQMFADIMAGRLAGMTTIYVTPIHPEQEHWFTRIKRPPERVALKFMRIADLSKIDSDAKSK